MINRKIALCLLTASVGLSVTGCGTPLYELTDEETELVTAYSAKIVSKYNELAEVGVCNASILEGEIDPIDEADLKPIDDFIDISSEVIASSDAGTQPETVETSYEVNSTYNLSDILEVEGIDFYVKQFNIDDAYVDEGVFSTTASSGNKFLILDICATNTTDQPIDVDMLSKTCEFQLTINNSNTAKSQTTILLNDLSTYQGTISPGDSEDLVLLFQFSTSALEYVDAISMDVTMNGVSKRTNI